ncbi:vitamin B12 dependent-methionine synthase activation domain-containing protein [Candidatus Riflebacteria bacterium]
MCFKKITKLEIADVIPVEEDIHKEQGLVPPIRDKIQSLIDASVALFSNSARPEGMVANLSCKDFYEIFQGEGKNAESNPLEMIYPKAAGIALFAITMGHEVSKKIELLFNDGDYALGSMLDTVASLAAEKAVTVFEKDFSNHLGRNFLVLAYSPGYCGWHISGQKRIFCFLQPEKIGISLSDSYLMTPLKSVTGLLVAGNRAIHLFKNNYPFCRFCKIFSCRERISSYGILS